MKFVSQLIGELETFLTDREAEATKRNTHESVDDIWNLRSEIANARETIRTTCDRQFKYELEFCSALREAFFTKFLEARANARKCKVLSDQWLACENTAHLYLDLSKIPTRFLTPEKLQEMATQEGPDGIDNKIGQ